MIFSKIFSQQAKNRVSCEASNWWTNRLSTEQTKPALSSGETLIDELIKCWSFNLRCSTSFHHCQAWNHLLTGLHPIALSPLIPLFPIINALLNYQVIDLLSANTKHTGTDRLIVVILHTNVCLHSHAPVKHIICIHSVWLADKQTDRQTDTQTDRHTNR